MAEELTLSIDARTGEYTRLTRFHPGADTAPFGGKSGRAGRAPTRLRGALACAWGALMLAAAVRVATSANESSTHMIDSLALVATGRS